MTSPAYSKFLPEDIPEWQMPFWDSLRARQARVQRCEECGRFRYIPKELCPNCHSSRYDWDVISGQGHIYTYTVVHRAPTPAYQADAPYVLVHVSMEEGFRMAGALRGVEPQAVHIDLPVRLVYQEATPDWTLFGFTPL